MYTVGPVVCFRTFVSGAGYPELFSKESKIPHDESNRGSFFYVVFRPVRNIHVEKTLAVSPLYCRSTYCFLSSRYQSTILCFNTFLPLSQSCGLCLIPFFSLECLFLYSGPPREEEGKNGQDRDLLSIGGGQASNLVSFFFFFMARSVSHILLTE